jgi:hypothetical protein
MREGRELLMSKDAFHVNVHRHTYANLYFIERSSLTYLQSATLMKDPELIDGLEKLNIVWAWKMQSRDFVIALFNNHEMKTVNLFLDKFAGEYRKREPEILKRLKSLGIKQ